MESNQIEQLIEEHLKDAQRVPMNEQVTRFAVQLVFVDMSGEKLSSEKPFLMKLIEKRVEVCFTYTISECAALLLAMVAGYPGAAVIYCWYLQYWCKKNNVKDVTLTRLMDEIFPFGFFSEEDLRRVWEAQKIAASPDNMLDHAKYGESLQFEREEVKE